MTPRTQAMIAALAVLLVGMGAVLFLVGDAGVQTSVYSADNTATPLPTVTPTPIPAIAADEWSAVTGQPDAWEYLEAGASLATIQKGTTTLAELTGGLPLENEALPILAALELIRADLEGRIASLPPEVTATIDGPHLQLVGDIPVSLLRFTVISASATDESADTVEDVALVFFDESEEQITYVQYSQSGPRNERLYPGFMTWLTENAPDLAPSDAEESDESSDTGAEDDGDADADADADTDTDADTGGDADTDADADADTGSTDGDEASGDISTNETWIELAPGQLYYAANPDTNASIVHAPITMAEVLGNLDVDPASDEAPETVEELLTLLKTTTEANMEADGLVVGTDATIEGPVFSTAGDVPLSHLEIDVAASTDATGQELPSQTVYQYLIDLGEGNLYFIQFTYIGEIDPKLEIDFQTWLNENAPVFAEQAETAE